MARTITRAALRARIRLEADLGSDATSGRYPNVNIDNEINSSVQAMRELVSSPNRKLYLKPTAFTTMTVGPLAGYRFGTVPLPVDAVQVYSIEIQLSTAENATIYAGDFAERNEYSNVYGGPNGTPESFELYNIGAESGASVTPGVIAIFPAPDRAYQYSIWYLPNWTDIATGAGGDTSVINGYAGFDDYVVWDCVSKFCIGDADRQQVYAMAEDQKKQALARMLVTVSHTQRAGPVQRRPIREELQFSNWRNRLRWP